MNWLSLKSDTAHNSSAVTKGDRSSLEEFSQFRRNVVSNRQAKHVFVQPIDISLIGTAEPCGVFDQSFQNGIKVERRAADHLKDFACSGLLLQGLGEVAIADLQLLKKPHVLDRDDGLIGEGFEEGNLLLGKRSN